MTHIEPASPSRLRIAAASSFGWPRRRRLGFSVAVLVAVGAGQPLGLGANVAAAQQRVPVALSHRDIAAGTVFAAAAGALLPFDQRIAHAWQRPSLQRSRALHDAARTFNIIGVPGVFVGALASYGVGRLGRVPSATETGAHVTEAIMLGGAVTTLIKDVAGRQRPYVDHATPHDFRLGGGFSNAERSSFPSGHTTAAFAAAAMVAEESRRFWPRQRQVITPLAYTSATMVGLARLYTDRHWASDVVFGAGIGTLSGLLVSHLNHARPDNRLDRFLKVEPMPRR